MKQKNVWISLLGFLILCLTVEAISAYWTNQTVTTWYPRLIKASWTPPNWLFGPVWFTLYIMIAISGWLIYKAEYSQHRSTALFFYAAQLAANFAWSFLFFLLQRPALALIDISALCLLILLTIVNAWPVNRLASYLLIPYLTWVMYATSLNAAIWLFNS